MRVRVRGMGRVNKDAILQPNPNPYPNPNPNPNPNPHPNPHPKPRSAPTACRMASLSAPGVRSAMSPIMLAKEIWVVRGRG